MLTRTLIRIDTWWLNTGRHRADELLGRLLWALLGRRN